MKGLEEHLNDILNSPDNIEGWAGSLLSLPEIIQDLLFQRVWISHQKIDGIHLDFGRVSYINSDEISEYYWTNQDQRFELVLQLIGTLQEADNNMKAT